MPFEDLQNGIFLYMCVKKNTLFVLRFSHAKNTLFVLRF